MQYDIMEQKTNILTLADVCDKHGKSCYESYFTSLYVREDLLFFVKGSYYENGYPQAKYPYDMPYGKILCAYDTQTGIATEIMEISGRFDYVESAGEEFVFFASETEITDMGNTVQHWFYYRYHPKTERLIGTYADISSPPLFISCDDTTIVWEEKGEYLTTDINFQNKRAYEPASEMTSEYFYETEMLSSQRFHLYRTNTETGQKEIVFENAHSARRVMGEMMNGYLYLPIDPNNYKNKSYPHVLAYVDLNDLSVKKVWNLPDNYMLTTLLVSHANDFDAGGNYVALFVRTEDVDENDRAYTNDVLMLLDIESGDYDIIECSETRNYLK